MKPGGLQYKQSPRQANSEQVVKKALKDLLIRKLFLAAICGYFGYLNLHYITALGSKRLSMFVFAVFGLGFAGYELVRSGLMFLRLRRNKFNIAEGQVTSIIQRNPLWSFAPSIMVGSTLYSAVDSATKTTEVGDTVDLIEMKLCGPWHVRYAMK